MSEVVKESSSANVLFVDDDKAFLKTMLRGAEHRLGENQYLGAHDEKEALLSAKKYQPEVIILDLNLKEEKTSKNSLDFIPKLVEFSPYSRIIILTGQDQAEWGIRSVNAGAASFLTKPASLDHLIVLIKDAIQVSKLFKAAHKKDNSLKAALTSLGLRTKSESMAQVLEQAAIAATSNLSVLLCGETGVGKGVLAKAIHQASDRSNKPFIRVQPHFGSHDLIVSELFGHTKGAFTGASKDRDGFIKQADGGTLFVDEIDTLPRQTQIALLNVLQEKEFQPIGSNKVLHSDFRLISATNTPFNLLIGEDKLRPDFFHRIAHSIIHIPPLRERRADIPDLAEEFISKIAAKSNETLVYGLTHEAKTWLSTQEWPGNVRELEASVERAYVQAKYYKHGLIQLSDFKKHDVRTAIAPAQTLNEQIKNFELTIVAESFAKNAENYTATAKALGVDRKRLKRILSQLEN